VLICHPKHPLAKEKNLKLSHLEGQKFIAFESDIPTRKAIDKILRDSGVAVKNTMEFDNIETVKRAVEIEAGVSIVPESTVVQEVSKQTLAALKFSEAIPTRPLAIIAKKTKVLSPAMKQFIQLLKEPL
jgi:DNA-binding transcriptional LysR family regulator